LWLPSGARTLPGDHSDAGGGHDRGGIGDMNLLLAHQFMTQKLGLPMLDQRTKSKETNMNNARQKAILVASPLALGACASYAAAARSGLNESIMKTGRPALAGAMRLRGPRGDRRCSYRRGRS
jgi:hypothetical protein